MQIIVYVRKGKYVQHTSDELYTSLYLRRSCNECFVSYEVMNLMDIVTFTATP